MSAIYERFSHTLNAVAKLARLCGLCGVPLFYSRLRMPIVSVALDKQVEGRYVEIKHHCSGHGVLGNKANGFLFESFPHHSFNRTLSNEPAVTPEGAKASVRRFRWRGPELFAASAALQYDRRAATSLRTIGALSAVSRRISEGFTAAFTSPVSSAFVTAFLRALLIPLVVTAVRKEVVAANFAMLLNSTSAGAVIALLRAKTVVIFGGSELRATLCAVGIGTCWASQPHRVSAARSTAPGLGAGSGKEFFAAIRTGVNVFISHGVNLTDRLTFWLGPRGCWSHSRGPLILPRIAL